MYGLCLEGTVPSCQILPHLWGSIQARSIKLLYTLATVFLSAR